MTQRVSEGADYTANGTSPSVNVSVVIPTHDRPETLARLVESLRLLRYENERLEVIVVGGNQDRGRSIVEALGDSYNLAATYFTVPDNQLHSAAFKRNTGAQLARGEILAFTDDDCVVHPNWIATAMPFFSDPVVGAVEGAVEIPKPAKQTRTYKGSQRLSQSGGYQTCNMFYRKSVFQECGGFDLSFPYYLEDTDLAFSVIERGYRIPFAANSSVSHPVPPARPLKLLTMAKTVEQMPYLFLKHEQSRARLKAVVRPFNRSHYFYLVLYAAALLLGLGKPSEGATVLGLGLAVMLPLHLLRDFWGLHVTPSELALTAACQPIVPLMRVFYLVKGLVRLALTGSNRARSH